MPLLPDFYVQRYFAPGDTNVFTAFSWARRGRLRAANEGVNVGGSASIHEPSGSPIVDDPAPALRPAGHAGRPGRCLAVAWRIGGDLHWASPRGSGDPCAPMDGLVDGTSGLRSARSR